MSSDDTKAPSLEQYVLVALIDIYRGLEVRLPVDLDETVQNKVLRDVLSAAISFSNKPESMQQISEELFNCVKEGCTLKSQMSIIHRQSPEILNAKMTAAAYLLKIINKENNII